MKYAERKRFTVRIRRDMGLIPRPDAELIDGKTFEFEHLWQIEEDDTRYPNEHAWRPVSEDYPIEGPSWIASGDLQEPNS